MKIKPILFLLALCTIIVVDSGFRNRVKDEYWGFCTAIDGKTAYVSSVITFPLKDTYEGLLNENKVIRSWKVTLKEILGSDYNELIFFRLHQDYCSYFRSATKLMAAEDRACFIERMRTSGYTIKPIAFAY